MELQKAGLEKQIATLERKIEKKPEGTLTYVKVRNYYRYYSQVYKDGKRTRTYLKDDKAKTDLAIKRMQTILLSDAQNELEAIEAYLKKRKDKSTAAFFEAEALRNLLFSIYTEWANAEYETNPYHRESLTVEGANGVYVQSKSEGDISWDLADDELPNRYGQKMTLSGRDVYPDFTIIHPLTGKQIIWEHFGMMDKESYVQRTYKKISLYMENGYFPGDNLIMTFEDKKHPLSHRKIQETIKEYFGDWLEVRKK